MLYNTMRTPFNFVTLTLLVVNYQCIKAGSLDSFDRKADIDPPRVHTNSTNQSEFEHGDDVIIHRSERQDRQREMIRVHAARCSTDQPKLVDGYYYKFQSSEQIPNEVVSVGVAYLLAIKYNVLERNPKYFDIIEFTESGIKFPPTLPIVCYDTAYSMHGSAVIDYGRAGILQTLNNRHNASLRSTSAYTVESQKLYGELAVMVADMRPEQKETLEVKCRETYNYRTKITDVITQLLGDNSVQAMAPTYSLEQFNQVAQLLIGDILAHEMIRQACMAVGSERMPEITEDEWRPIRDKLRAGANAIRNNWHETQLQKDVHAKEAYQELVRPAYESDILVSFSDELMEKYYGHSFRVTIHSNWKAEEAKIICSGTQNLKCFDLSDAMVLIRWRSLNPAGPAASFDIPQQHRKFPIVRPPAPSYKFSALYAKVHAVLNKTQNAVNYLRVTHLQNRFYNQSGNIFSTFINATPPDMYEYAETAENFATSLDSLYVFTNEFRCLIDTFSEVATHTGQPGVNKVWVLIDRSFFEMDFYMADIEEHIMQLRRKVLDKNRDYTHYFALKKVLFGNRSEELRKIRKAFNQYQKYSRFYTKKGNHLGAAEVIKKLFDSCELVKRDITNIRNSLTSRKIREAIQEMGGFGPFYFYVLYSVMSYDVAYLTMYNLFCVSQRYKWISIANLGQPQTRMTTPDVHKFLNSIMKDVMDISDALNEATEAISKQVYKSKFSWTYLISLLVERERRVTPSDSNAVRIANKWNRGFPWLSFSVVFVKDDSTGHTIDNGEKMFYNKFFVNPDYSLVRSGYEDGSTVIVNWAPKKTSSEMQTNATNFGFSVGSNQLCNMPSNKLTSFLKNYQNIKSFFIWRNYIGHGGHYQSHVNNHDGSELNRYVDRPCYYKSGSSNGTFWDAHVCWHRHTVRYLWGHCSIGYGYHICHRDDKVGIYSLGNVGEDY